MQEIASVIWMSLVLFIILLIMAKIVGRKLLSQMNYSEFVTAISMGTIAGAFVVNEVHGFYVLLSPLILAIATFLVSFTNLKTLAVRKVVEGEPVVVIQNGKILEKNMKKLRYNLDNLEAQLRGKDIFDISQVEFAVSETHGALSILKKSEYETVTKQDLGKSATYKGIATEIIKDGDVMDQNLKQNNLSFGWLYNELHKQGINDINDVVYASLKTDGTLYTDVRNDKLGYIQEVED